MSHPALTPSIRPGRTCLLSSVSNAWRQFGYEVPESTLFMLGAGNRVDCRIELRDGSPLIFVGHHSAEIVENFCHRFSVPHLLRKEPTEVAEIKEHVVRELDAGNPLIAWVEMRALPYIDMYIPPGSMHAVTIETIEGDHLVVADCFVTHGLYNAKVSTHRAQIPLTDFVAWERTGYLRHEIEFKALGCRSFNPSSWEIATSIEQAALDFFGGKDSENNDGSGARLLSLADDLPRLYQDANVENRAQLFNSLAYSIRYFGTLWSREFLSAAMQSYADEHDLSALRLLGDRLASTVRSWKTMMYLALKTAMAKSNASDVQRLRVRMRETVQQEQLIYQQLLALQLIGSTPAEYSYSRVGNPSRSPQFGFGSENGE